MSEPPHQVPFDAWNLQLRPDGWDDLGLALQSHDLEGGDGQRDNPTASIAAPLAPSTFRYGYINTTDPYYDISDGPPLRDEYSNSVPIGSSIPLLNEYTNPAASTFGHEVAPHPLYGYSNLVSTVPTIHTIGLAAISASNYGNLDPRTFAQSIVPPLLSTYDGLIPNVTAPSSPIPFLNGHTVSYPAGDFRDPALLIQDVLAGNTAMPADRSSLGSSTIPGAVTLEAGIPKSEIPTAAKESKSEYICPVCNEDCKTEWFLECHAATSRHAAFQCAHENCDETFRYLSERREHERQLEAHLIGHSRIRPLSVYGCDECNQAFNSHADLHRHAREQQHAAYACKCTRTFSRVDVLQRHLDQYLPGKPKYPCTHCKRHRGNNGFKRKQHLTQHLRGYHHINLEVNFGYGSRFLICPHSDCPGYRGPQFYELSLNEQVREKPFLSQGEFSKHMRDAHNESSFPCDITHCPRVGGNGFFRETAFLKHRKSQHPNAPPYVISDQQTYHSSPESNL